MTKAKRTTLIYKALHRKSGAPHVVPVVLLLLTCFIVI